MERAREDEMADRIGVLQCVRLGDHRSIRLAVYVDFVQTQRAAQTFNFIDVVCERVLGRFGSAERITLPPAGETVDVEELAAR